MSNFWYIKLENKFVLYETHPIYRKKVIDILNSLCISESVEKK